MWEYQELPLEGVTVVVLCGSSLAEQVAVNARCRATGVKFVTAETRGVFGWHHPGLEGLMGCRWVFVDMGEGFVTNDKDGETLKECMVPILCRSSLGGLCSDF